MLAVVVVAASVCASPSLSSASPPPPVEPCTWANGCCPRHPTASICRRTKRRTYAGRGPQSAASAQGVSNQTTGQLSLEEVGAATAYVAETPAERERGILTLRRAAERRAALERKFQPKLGTAGLFYLLPT